MYTQWMKNKTHIQNAKIQLISIICVSCLFHSYIFLYIRVIVSLFPVYTMYIFLSLHKTKSARIFLQNVYNLSSFIKCVCDVGKAACKTSLGSLMFSRHFVKPEWKLIQNLIKCENRRLDIIDSSLCIITFLGTIIETTVKKELSNHFWLAIWYSIFFFFYYIYIMTFIII